MSFEGRHGSIARRTARSLIGSLINQFAVLLLVLLAFGGFWLNDRFAVPAWLLIVVGVACVCLVICLDTQVWRAYARRGAPAPPGSGRGGLAEPRRPFWQSLDR